MPLASLGPPVTSNRIVMAAHVPAAEMPARPPNIVGLAASSSRWKGWGSNSAAKRLMSAALTSSVPLVKVSPI